MTHRRKAGDAGPEVRALVVKGKNEPATAETRLVPDPGPGEALLDVVTCGVCQTDLHYEVGGVGDDFPFLLGHEASGVMAAAGEGVTKVAVGTG
jgi:S-(hydroxymethyl)mycothiol dehydrogenase